jgi:putative hydrolase of the HAD superfamily
MMVGGMDRSFVWFDFGGVLSPPIQDLFALYHEKTGISPEQLQDAMTAVARQLGVPMLAPVELAMLTEREWGRRMREHLASAYRGLDLGRARLEEFGRQWFDDVTPNFPMVNTLLYFRENGFGVGILTNNVIEWEPHWKRITAGVGDSTLIIDSCKVGARKPQPEIFAIAEKEAGLPPGVSILIDDVAENCAAANAVGWRSVHFRDNAQSCRELQTLTGLPAII